MAAKKTAEDKVQDAVDEETARGFNGIEVDPTPNENYTVDGVTSGKPTPETDDKAAGKAAESASAARSRFTER